MNIEFDYYTCAFGAYKIATYNGRICMVDFVNRKNADKMESKITKALNGNFVQKNNALIESCKCQLNEYFNAQREVFDLPLLIVGTDFQKSVWQALQSVSYAQTISYLQLAHEIQKPSAVRAVANAVGANALAIIIPCHRIIGSNNTLTGYAGGLELKKKLLELENAL